MRQDTPAFLLTEAALFFDAGVWLLYSKQPQFAAGFCVFAIVMAGIYKWAGK